MKLIYLMGAGRSGTTILASLLGNSKQILSLGEMHQFLEKILHKEPCACGKNLEDCEFWNPIISKILEKYTAENLKKINNHNHRIEDHKKIIPSFFRKDNAYINFQIELLKIIFEKRPSDYYLDSTKYISKALQLLKIKTAEVKIIYVVRDVRGVIYSFGKNVQTPKGPLATIVYYSLINFFGELVKITFGRKKVLKIRYEDLVEDTQKELLKIGTFANIKLTDVMESVLAGNAHQTEHFIGGNRMILKKNIVLRKDLQWKQKTNRTKQILYYFLTFPLMLFNKYSI